MKPKLALSGQERLNSEGLDFLTQGADLKMRKRKGRQGRERQPRLFDRGEVSMRPDHGTDGGTESARKREFDFLSLLARNRALTGTLLETVMSATNLNQAYEAVKKNGGAPGIDGLETASLRAWLGENGQALIRAVLAGGRTNRRRYSA